MGSKRRKPFARRLTLTILIVVIVATLLRQMALRARTFHTPRRQSAREIAPTATPSQGGPLPTPVSALPRQQAPSDLPKADGRTLLRHEADTIVQAIESGRDFGKRSNIIVEAHFAIGTNTWVVRDAAAPGVAQQFQVASSTPPEARGPGKSRGVEKVASTERATANDKPATGEGWRFIAFRGPEGERLEPIFVFFPDGTVQGGMVELGWDDLHAVIGLDPSGHVTVECPGAFPMAATMLPPPGAGVDRDSKDDNDKKDSKANKDEKDQKDGKDDKAPDDHQDNAAN